MKRDMADIEKCPVCGNNDNQHRICPVCGYDISADYSQVLTIGTIPENSRNIKALHRDYEKKHLIISGYAEKMSLKNQVEELCIELRAELRKELQEELQNELPENRLKDLQNKLLEEQLKDFMNRLLEAVKNVFPEDMERHQPETEGKLKTGDTIKFGRYMQIADEVSDSEEPIEWIVLSKEDNKLLLLSRYVLDCRRFDKKHTVSSTWETCKLRKWLNSKFLQQAFSAEEAERILTVTVTADKNPDYDTNPGNDTEDQIFLLSIDETEKYFRSQEARMCVPTEFATNRGIIKSNHEVDGEATCWWWLRSPGEDSENASYVDSDGEIDSDGFYVDDKDTGVRPALWLQLEGSNEPDEAKQTEYIAIRPEISEKDSSAHSADNSSISRVKSYNGNSIRYKSQGQLNIEKNIEKYEAQSKYSIGATIKIGRYQQSAGGKTKEPIEWIVLERWKDRVLLVSKFILDYHPYNNEYISSLRWEECSLCHWLNKEFLIEAFSYDEAAQIVSGEYEAGLIGIRKYAGDGEQHVFLLSQSEVHKYFPSDKECQCRATDYLIAKDTVYIGESKNRWWWLRTDDAWGHAGFVNRDGRISDFDVRCENIGVRPALWLNIES